MFTLITGYLIEFRVFWHRDDVRYTGKQRIQVVCELYKKQSVVCALHLHTIDSFMHYLNIGSRCTSCKVQLVISWIVLFTRRDPAVEQYSNSLKCTVSIRSNSCCSQPIGVKSYYYSWCFKLQFLWVLYFLKNSKFERSTDVQNWVLKQKSFDVFSTWKRTWDADQRCSATS